jgi:malonyl-CoA/methylmalonyl-CoA synthetase
MTGPGADMGCNNAHLRSPAMAASLHLSPGVTVDLTAGGNLPAAWVAHWRAAPDRPVVHDPSEGWVSGAELDRRTAEMAGRFAAAGLLAGDRVLLSGSASVTLVVAHVGALRAGLVVVPVNSAYSPRELEMIVTDAHPAMALIDEDPLRAAAAELGVDVTLPESSAPVDLDAAAPGDAALLPYTSGTTGTPKGVLLSHANLLAGAHAVRLAWRWTSDDRLILSLPLFHMHGMGVGLHGTLLAGASVILQPVFDPEAVLSAAARDDTTMFFGVPTMYVRLVDAPGADRLSRLRLCVSGSAPLDADLHARIAARCGQIVLERYGMTETVMLTSNPLEGERRAGTVGVPLPGVDLRLAEGTSEVLVRGPNVFAGYLGQPEATRAVFTADGWFRTGDIGAMDDDGYLRIAGRAKELIITGGYNVYPREVEDVLRLYPTVADAAVVGTPSSEWGELVTAYVETHEDLDVNDLVSFANERLAPYKRPRLVHVVATLPRNRLGKVLRDRLHPA